MTKDKQLKLIQQLAKIFEELDWLVAIPLENEECKGLIVGEKEFVEDVAKAYYGEQAEIIGPHVEQELLIVEEDSDADIDATNQADPQKTEKKTLH